MREAEMEIAATLREEERKGSEDCLAVATEAFGSPRDVPMRSMGALGTWDF